MNTAWLTGIIETNQEDREMPKLYQCAKSGFLTSRDTTIAKYIGMFELQA